MAENNNANIPLYKRVHWRSFRAFLSKLCKQENIDISNFNTNKIMCYETLGDQLKGANVKYKPNNLSCWVGDNRYEVYEIPSLQNHERSLSGHFLVFAYNLEFDYWVVAYMDHGVRTKESKQKNTIIEDILYTVIGRFVSSMTKVNSITYTTISKIEDGKDVSIRWKYFQI